MFDFKPERSRRKKRGLIRGRSVKEEPKSDGISPWLRPQTGNQRQSTGPGVEPGKLLSGAARLLLKTGFAAVLLWLAVGIFHEGRALWQAPLAGVEVTGNRVLSAETVALGAGLRAGMRMSEIDPFQAALRLHGQPWIKTAEVRRIFPGKVAIKVEERRPYAMLYSGKESRTIIDEEGVVLSNTSGEMAAHSRLPRIIYGRADPRPGQRLAGPAPEQAMALLREAERLGIIGAEPVTLSLDNPFSLLLSLHASRIRLLLPLTDFSPALAMFRQLRPELLGDSMRGNSGKWRTLEMRSNPGPKGVRVNLW